MEENNVHIVDWPKGQAANLEHHFKDPIPVEVSSPREKPLNVNMNMLLNEKQQVPLCIKLCEPICAESSYKVGITLLGQPFIEIVVKGLTRLFNCRDIRSSDDKSDETVKPDENVIR